jgi:hypothetical protein
VLFSKISFGVDQGQPAGFATVSEKSNGPGIVRVNAGLCRRYIVVRLLQGRVIKWGDVIPQNWLSSSNPLYTGTL